MMRQILDKLFENKKLSILMPILISAIVYLLFAIFGVAEEKGKMAISTPIICLIWFFGVFLVVYVQVRNKICPEWFLNFVELFITVSFGVYSIFEVISFIISGFQNFNPVICAGIITYSAVSWAHSKRAKL